MSGGEAGGPADVRASGRGEREREGAEHAADRVECDARVAAEPERVWEAWADPERIAGWFVERAVNRAEEGARVTWAWDRFGLEVEQEVVVADSPRRLVMKTPGPTGGARILEVTLEAERSETVVRVVQSGFGDGPAADAAREGTESGWVIALALLGHYVENWFGRSKSELVALRPVARDCTDVAAYHRETARLAEWLTTGTARPADADGDGAAGSGARRTRLTLRDGGRSTGIVLAEAGSERVRTWEEIGGTLELKAFPVATGGCMVGVRVVSWLLSQREVDRLAAPLEAAVDRLAARLGSSIS